MLACLLLVEKRRRNDDAKKGTKFITKARWLDEDQLAISCILARLPEYHIELWICSNLNENLLRFQQSYPTCGVHFS